MTEENRRKNAQDELQRAADCLREAELLAQARLAHGASARAYYAVFHAARALLFSVGLEPVTHRGVLALLGEHFVKPGRLSAELGRLVAHMHRDREDADYATGAVFTEEQGRRAVQDAQLFVEAARRASG